MSLLQCDICERKVVRRVELADGRRVCELCNEKSQNGETLSVDTPDVYIWIGEVSKMKDKFYFNIPKEQKPFFKHKERYSIVVRKL